MDIKFLYENGVIDAETYIDLLEKQFVFTLENRNALAAQVESKDKAIRNLALDIEDLQSQLKHEKDSSKREVARMGDVYREMRDAHNKLSRLIDISNYFKLYRKDAERVGYIERKLGMLRESMTVGEVAMWLCQIMPIKQAERYARKIDPVMLKKERVLLEYRGYEGTLAKLNE